MWWLITFYYKNKGILTEKNLIFNTLDYRYLNLMFDDYCKIRNIKCEYVSKSKLSDDELVYVKEKVEMMDKKQRTLIGKAWNSTLNVYKYENKPKPVNKIKPLSNKRRSEERVYLKTSRPEYMSDNPFCEVKVEGCTRIATQIHHKKGRIGSLLNDKRYFCSICDNCHRWIGDNTNKAREMGFYLLRVNNE